HLERPGQRGVALVAPHHHRHEILAAGLAAARDRGEHLVRGLGDGDLLGHIVGERRHPARIEIAQALAAVLVAAEVAHALAGAIAQGQQIRIGELELQVLVAVELLVDLVGVIRRVEVGRGDVAGVGQHQGPLGGVLDRLAVGADLELHVGGLAHRLVAVGLVDRAVLPDVAGDGQLAAVADAQRDRAGVDAQARGVFGVEDFGAARALHARRIPVR
ncbi:hypothetical protein CATMIT_01968, partial [Catenibacterium mitsuokai DSM 15897]